MSEALCASGVNGEPKTALYQLLRHAFSAAQSSSVGDKYWRLSSCFTGDRHVMTEYVAKDGSRIRADSTGERGDGGYFPNHEFTFYPEPPKEANP